MSAKSNYFQSWQKAFKIICQYKFLFLIPFSLHLFSFIVQFIGWLLYRNSIQGISSQMILPTQTISKYLIRLFSISVDWLDLACLNSSLFLFMLVFILFPFVSKFIQRYLVGITDNESAESIFFLRKLIKPMIGGAVFFIFISAWQIYLLTRGNYTWQGFAVVMLDWSTHLSHFAFFIYACFGTIFSSLIEGGILVALIYAIKNKVYSKENIYLGALRYFKPLFIFNIIILIISYLFSMIGHTPYLFRIVSTTSGLQASTIVYPFSLIFAVLKFISIFVPYIIVSENVNIYNALKFNFRFWGKNLVKIIPWLFLSMIWISLLNLIWKFFFSFVAIHSYSYQVLSFLTTIYQVFIAVIVMVSIMDILCQNLPKIVSELNNSL
jgi:hypothetical protein